MEKKIEVQNYINNFRRLFSSFLKPGVGISSTIYPYNKGIVLIFELGENYQNKDDFRSPSNTVNEALKRTNLFENEMDHSETSFNGTNIFLTKNKIVIIKDENPKELLIDKAQNDIFKILSSSNIISKGEENHE